MKLKISAEEHARRMALYRQGLLDTEIGEKIGLGYSGVCRWRKLYNLPPNRKRVPRTKTPYHKMVHDIRIANDFRRLRRKDTPIWNAVADKYNVRPSVAYCHIKRLLLEEEQYAN